MPFLRRHWYDVGLVVAVITVIGLVLTWNQTTTVQKLLLGNFIAILLHQFEEYGWPGGEPAIMNMVLQPSPRPDRFPLNQQSAMVVNVLITYGVYLPPVFFPDIVWLGMAPVLFAFGQFVVHGVATNKKLRSFYNPGLGAVVFLHYPLGIAYLFAIYATRPPTVTDWVLTFLYIAALVVVVMKKMTYTWLVDENSPYPFAPDEMRRFNVPAKLKQLGATDVVAR